jgi:hypothetical protein
MGPDLTAVSQFHFGQETLLATQKTAGNQWGGKTHVAGLKKVSDYTVLI